MIFEPNININIKINMSKKNEKPFIQVVWVALSKTQLNAKSLKTNSTRVNPLLGFEGQTQLVSTQKSAQLFGLNPKSGSGFQPPHNRILIQQLNAILSITVISVSKRQCT